MGGECGKQWQGIHHGATANGRAWRMGLARIKRKERTGEADDNETAEYMKVYKIKYQMCQ